MKTCLFCSNTINDNFNECPHCGSSNFKKKSYRPAMYTKLILSLISAIISLATFIICIKFMFAPCKHDYVENKEYGYNSSYNMDGKRYYTCQKCSDSYTEVIPMLEKPVEVTVLNKNTRETDTTFKKLDLGDGTTLEIPNWGTKYVSLDIELKNIKDEDISNIKGTLWISNKDSKYGLDFSYDDVIPANSSIVVKEEFVAYSHDLSFTYDRLFIFNASHESLKYNFNLYEATFAEDKEEITK